MKYLEETPSGFNPDEDDSWRTPLTDPFLLDAGNRLRFIWDRRPSSLGAPAQHRVSQYVRTGIIPDDEETVAYAKQEGAPFRLLEFAPSTILPTEDGAWR
jgi:hypothetical protein